MSGVDTLHLDALRDSVLRVGGGALVVAEWTAPANTQGEEIAPPHVHHEDDEIWYVLEGSLGFSFADETFDVPAGGIAYARAGTTHTYWNASPGETRYLLVMSKRIDDLIATLHDPERRGNRSFADVFREHASSLA